MSSNIEKPNDVAAILQRIGDVPDQIKDDSVIEVTTEQKVIKKSLDTDVKISELRNIIELRQLWGKCLLLIISVILIGNMGIVYLTGLGILTFTGNTLPTFVASNLAEIFALCIIVVKFLFNTKTGK
jgi:hypothetical protein cdivTM_07084